MNERIQELAYQAEDQADQIADQAGEFHPAFCRIFAELIVRECTNVVSNAVDHREPASTYVGKIKKHFGVEEGMRYDTR